MQVNLKEDRLAAAVRIAAEAHAGQVDKAGQPYILHPLAVLAIVEHQLRDAPVEDKGDLSALRCVAVLHDVLEDVPAEERDDWQDRIFAECGERCRAAVSCISRRRGEVYSAYIRRVMDDWMASRVKRADLTHNLMRGASLPMGRGMRYVHARALLERAAA